MAISRRGSVKRKKGHFQQGHKLNSAPPGYRRVTHRAEDGSLTLQGGQRQRPTSSPITRPVKRHSKAKFRQIIKKTSGGQLTIPGPDGAEGSAILLRPKCDPPSGEPGTDNSSCDLDYDNVIVKKSLLLKALNTSIREHGLEKCTDINMDLVNIVPWGHYIKVKVACTNCDYMSNTHYKLYDEVDRKGPGPREAKGNLRLQYLLQEMPIGNEKVRLVLAALGLRAGSRSGMQNNANKVGVRTIELNKNDMSQWADEVKSVLQARGVENPHKISAAMDGRYDGASLRSWVTPGLGATAATGIMVEKVTDDQKVISMVHYNKTCTMGTRLRAQGKHALCGQGLDSHAGCTATMPYHEDISERQMGKDMATELLSNNGVIISHLTTDGDALSHQGICEAYQDNNIEQTVTRFSDLTHLGALQRKHIMQHSFSQSAFGCKPDGSTWLYQERLKCRQALANDIEVRCALTVRNMFKHYKNEKTKVENSCDIVRGYMHKCYSGDHSKCRSAPLARLTGCQGKNNKTWFDTSAHLSSQRMTGLNLKGKDQEKVDEVIKMKLAAENIGRISQLATTQKVESVNHALNISDPKNQHWCRNAAARNHSAVHRVNNGPRESFRKKFESGGCELPKLTHAVAAIEDYDRRLKYSKLHKQKSTTISRSRQLKAEKLKNYYRNAWRKNNPGDYLKHQLDEARAIKRRAKEYLAAATSPAVDPTPGTSGTRDNELLQARQTVRKAKRDVKHYDKEQQRKKAAANRKRRKTWKRNEAMHKANRKLKQALREKNYNDVNPATRTIKHEHSYALVC